MFTNADADWTLIPTFILGMNDYLNQMQAIHDSGDTDEEKNDKLTTLLSM